MIASRMSSAVPTTLAPNSWLYGSTWLTCAAGVHDQVDAVGEPVPGRHRPGRGSASPMSPASTSRCSVGQVAEARGAARRRRVERRFDALPGAAALRRRRARCRSACRRSAPAAPASPAPGSGRGSRSRRSAAPCGLRRSGAAASWRRLRVSASMNLSSVRSLACTSAAVATVHRREGRARRAACCAQPRCSPPAAARSPAGR